MGFERKMVAMAFLLGIQFCNVCTAIAVDGDTEQVDGVASKSKDTCSMEKSPTSSRFSIVIGKLENKSEMSDSALVELRSRMQQCIAGTMKFHVQDRKNLKALLREQALAVAGIADSEGAEVPAATKVEPAYYMVLGTVQSCRTDHSALKADGARYAFVKSTIELQVKILNVNSGRILSEKTFWGHGMEKEIVSGGSKSSAGDGLRDAIYEASHAVAAWLRDVSECPPRVLKVDKAEVTIDMNENEVKEGDVFDIIEEGGVLVDPDTGAFLGSVGKCIGRVVITRTGLQSSKAKPIDGGRLSLETLDTCKHTYKLRRVNKSALMNEAKRRARKSSHKH